MYIILAILICYTINSLNYSKANSFSESASYGASRIIWVCAVQVGTQQPWSPVASHQHAQGAKQTQIKVLAR